MSQLRAKKSVDLYYKFPKTDYERFINKKWIEREDPFESKKTFNIGLQEDDIHFP